MNNPFGLVPMEEPQPERTLDFSEAARRALCKACGVEYKHYDPAPDRGKEVVRPSIRRGMVVCGPCGNKPIGFSNYCEARAGGDYGPSGGGWEVIVAQCPEHGKTILRATWKDLVAHPDDLIVAFSEQMALPEAPVEIEQRQKRILHLDESESMPIIDV